MPTWWHPHLSDSQYSALCECLELSQQKVTTRQLHGRLVNLISSGLGGLRFRTLAASAATSNTCRGLFTKIGNRFLKFGLSSSAKAGALQYRQGIIADLMIDATPIANPGA